MNLNEKIILIVEDDSINLLALNNFIKKKYKTLTAGSSDGVMDLLKNNKVDLILMDISIKGELDGIELTKKIKAFDEYSDIPVIALSGHSSEKDIENAMNAGFEDFFTKPFGLNHLLFRIEKLFKK